VVDAEAVREVAEVDIRRVSVRAQDWLNVPIPSTPIPSKWADRLPVPLRYTCRSKRLAYRLQGTCNGVVPRYG
jgi:hypothetical protein